MTELHILTTLSHIRLLILFNLDQWETQWQEFIQSGGENKGNCVRKSCHLYAELDFLPAPRMDSCVRIREAAREKIIASY